MEDLEEYVVIKMVEHLMMVLMDYVVLIDDVIFLVDYNFVLLLMDYYDVVDGV
jgi:hypothetical protein